MKNQLSRIVLILSAVVLSVYFLYPTFEDYRHRQKLATLTSADSTKYVEEHQDAILSSKLKRVKLGLDLQGGMRVVLEVDVLQLLDDLAKNKDDNFQGMMKEMRSQVVGTEEGIISLFGAKFQQRGIRLSRYYGSIRDEDSKILSQLGDETQKAIDRAIEIVRNRVDQYHVSEPNIQKQGSRRIIVELPGVKDEDEVRQLLKGTAKLEFRLLKDATIAYRVMESIDKFLAGKSDVDSTALKGKTAAKKEEKPKDALSELTGAAAAPSDTSGEAKFTREHPFFSLVRPDPRNSGEGYVEDKDRDRVKRLLDRPEIRQLMGPDFDILWSAKTIQGADAKKYYTIFPVRGQAELTGGVIVDAKASVDPEDNRPIVNMEMSSDGAREWARITGANINKRIAIAMDNSVFSAPNVQQKIVGGRSRITGMESPNEAHLLEIVLRAGALPAPVAIVEQRTVGPSLGEDSIRSGITAGVVALLFTMLFMIVYYHTSGSIADFALLFNVVFLLGVLAGFQATLTLPGISGIILTIGMAVDSNVLIFERIREELRAGKAVIPAVNAGFAKAFLTIIDTHITTVVSCAILFLFGSGPVKGFAVSLSLGIIINLFTSLLATRVVFDIVLSRGNVKRISI